MAHAGVCPRVVKPMKVNKYSTTYQMHEIRGNFAGLDSCNLVEYGTWMNKSMISFKNQALQVYGRPDIRSRLMKLGEQRQWPHDVCEAICNYSDELEDEYGDMIDKALDAATYIPAKECIEINASLNDQTQSVDETEENGEMVETMYTAPWPCVHSDINYYGGQGMSYAKKLPTLFKEDDDKRVLWILMSLAASSKMFYQCVVKSVHSQKEWHGWFLLYFNQQTRESSRSCNHAGNKIYKGKVKSGDVMKLLSKVWNEDETDISNMLEEVLLDVDGRC